MIECVDCQQAYPEKVNPHRCPECGGVYDFNRELKFQPDKVNLQLPGIWRYRESFLLPDHAPVISLGEGRTPLVWSEVGGTPAAFKLETLNPTGSFKDRGTALLISFLIGRGVQEAVEDSSGNAGASFAAYAARAGLKAKIFVPEYASGPKRLQILRSGAVIQEVPGPRSRAAEAVVRAVEAGAVYGSHAFLPHGLPGFATIAYELVEQLGQAPGSVVLPVGHGSLLLGLDRGFRALESAGLISCRPALIGVQAGACAPLAEAFSRGGDRPVEVAEGETLAEGVRIADPYRGRTVLKAVRESQGWFVQVAENEIRAGQRSLAELGFDVEMTSALVWDALIRFGQNLPQPLGVILTGHGLKEGR